MYFKAMVCPGSLVLTAAAVLQGQDAEVARSWFRDVGLPCLSHSALDLIPQVVFLSCLCCFSLSSLCLFPHSPHLVHVRC